MSQTVRLGSNPSTEEQSDETAQAGAGTTSNEQKLTIAHGLSYEKDPTGSLAPETRRGLLIWEVLQPS